MLQRVLTAIVLLGVVCGVLFFDRSMIGAQVLMGLVVTLSVIEWTRITACKNPLQFAPGGFLALLPFLYGPGIMKMPWLILCLLLPWMILHTVKMREPIGRSLYSNLWLFATLGSLCALVKLGNIGAMPMILVAAIPIWVGDTAAIFVGKWIGKHPMAPDISPKKTWEGGIGNALGCIAAAAVLGFTLKLQTPSWLLLGINTAVLGQAGDLFQSQLKRWADLKDSGTLLPGHGGILDRIDSLMASAPLSLLILALDR